MKKNYSRAGRRHVKTNGSGATCKVRICNRNLRNRKPDYDDTGREELYHVMNAFLDTLELIVHTMVEKFSWIPVDEVARILKMSVNTMTGLADSGLIPCKRNGGMIYFRSEDINDYMQAHKVKATPKA